MTSVGPDAGGDLPVVHDQGQVLPHGGGGGLHGHLGAPGADVDVPLPVDDQRGRAGAQVPDRLSLVVEAAARVGQAEGRVEGGDQVGPVPARQVGVAGPAPPPGLGGPGVPDRPDQVGVQPGHHRRVRRVQRVRAQVGDGQRRPPVHGVLHVPDTLARQGRARDRRDRGREPDRGRPGGGCARSSRGAERRGGRQLAADLRRLVGRLLHPGHERAGMVVPGPLGDPLGERVVARPGERATERDGHRDQQDGEDQARPRPAGGARRGGGVALGAGGNRQGCVARTGARTGQRYGESAPRQLGFRFLEIYGLQRSDVKVVCQPTTDRRHRPDEEDTP